MVSNPDSATQGFCKFLLLPCSQAVVTLKKSLACGNVKRTEGSRTGGSESHWSCKLNLPCMEHTPSEDVVQQAARALLTADRLAAVLDPQLAARVARGRYFHPSFL